MKINELLSGIHRSNFNINKELGVKKYLPIGEKKKIAESIIEECTSVENGAIQLDSVQQYLSYVKHMILNYTNLNYTDNDYDKLCATEYGETDLLGAIISSFGNEAKECSRILNLMIDDIMRKNSIEYRIGGLILDVGYFIDQLTNKVEELDVNNLSSLINKYIK